MKRYSIVSEWRTIAENAKSQLGSISRREGVMDDLISRYRQGGIVAERASELKQRFDGWGQSKNAIFGC